VYISFDFLTDIGITATALHSRLLQLWAKQQCCEAE
jgi:hypothetical protein